MLLYFWNPFSCPAFQGFYLICDWFNLIKGFPGGSVVKKPPANAGDTRDTGSTLGSERSPEVGNGNPLQYSSLGNPRDRGAWWPTVHGVTKSWTQLNNNNLTEGQR